MTINRFLSFSFFVQSANAIKPTNHVVGEIKNSRIFESIKNIGFTGFDFTIPKIRDGKMDFRLYYPELSK
ncbi:MAG: hypothetical protein ACJA1N_001872 [Saprospiraceae bacterium]|jgi:hypothetical protein